MKITGISIKNFRSHVDTRLDGLKTINVVLGRNGAGKSTILDAIAYALTGACRGITDAGAGADGLVSNKAMPPKRGKPNFTVSLTTDKGEILRAGGQGPKSAIQGSIDALHGSGLAAKYGARPDEFLALHPSDQRDIILGIYGTEAVSGVQVPANDLLAGRDLSTLAGIDEAEEYLRAMRPILKRQLAEMPAAAAATTEVSEAELARGRQQLLRLRQERDKVLADYNSKKFLKATSAAEADRLRGELADIQRLTHPDPDAIRRRLAEGAAAIQELEGVDARTSATISKAEADLAVMAAEMSRLTQTADRLKDVKSICPTCLRPYAEDARSKVLAGLKVEAAKVHDNMEKAKARIQTLAGDSHAQQVADLRKELAGLAEGLAQEPLRQKRTADLQRRLADHEARSAAPIDDDAPTRELDTRIENGEAWNDKHSKMFESHKHAAEAENRRKGLVNQLDQAESLIAYLGPQSPLRAALAGGPNKDFLADVNPILKGLGLPDMSLDQGWGMTIGGLRADLLSASERYRLGLAVACVLSRKSGLGLLCLDGAEILDMSNRHALASALECSGIEQAIVATTVVSSYGVLPEGWGAYQVEKADGVSKVSNVTVAVAA